MVGDDAALFMISICINTRFLEQDFGNAESEIPVEETQEERKLTDLIPHDPKSLVALYTTCTASGSISLFSSPSFPSFASRPFTKASADTNFSRWGSKTVFANTSSEI